MLVCSGVNNWFQTDFEQLEFKLYDSSNAAEQALLSNQVDIVGSDTYLGSYTWLKEQPGYSLTIRDAPGTLFAVFNTDREILADPRTRCALSMALDRQHISEALEGTKAVTLTPSFRFLNGEAPMIGWIQQPRTERMETARQLLESAGGWPEGRELEIALDPRDKKLALAISAMWQQLGVPVKLTLAENEALETIAVERNYDVGFLFWFEDYADRVSMLYLLKSNDANNYTQWGNETYDSLLAKASQTLKRADREPLYLEAEEIIKKECPIATIMHQQFFVFTNDRIEHAGQSDAPVILARLIKMNPQKAQK